MRKKKIDFLEKDVLAVDLSEEQVILTVGIGLGSKL